MSKQRISGVTLSLAHHDIVMMSVCSNNQPHDDEHEDTNADTQAHTRGSRCFGGEILSTITVVRGRRLTRRNTAGLTVTMSILRTST